MKTRTVQCLCLVLSVLLVLAGCGKPPEGEYAAQISAARSLRSYKNAKTKQPIVQFIEDCGDRKLPTLVLEFDDVRKTEEICLKIKETFKGLDIPWLATNFENPVLECLKDNEFASIGLSLSGELVSFDYVPPLESFQNLRRLNAVDADTPGDYHYIDKINTLASVRELITSGKNFLFLDKCPKLEKLTFSADYPYSATWTFRHDTSKITEIDTLKEVYTDDTPFGKATLYALLRENPQIENIKSVPPPTDAKELSEYNHFVQYYDISRLDTDGYTEIKWEDASLHGRIAVAGYDAAESISGFGTSVYSGEFRGPEAYLSGDLCSALTDRPTERDVIIRIYTQSNLVGHYTNGKNAYDLITYAEITDTVNKTIARKMIDSSGPSQVIRGNTGRTSGSFDSMDTWESIQELYNTLYRK